MLTELWHVMGTALHKVQRALKDGMAPSALWRATPTHPYEIPLLSHPLPAHLSKPPT